MDSLPFQTPFSAVIAGPSGVGKSFLVRDIIKYKDQMFSTVPDRIVWFYGIHQPLYDEIKDVEFVEGLPTNFREYLGVNTLFVIDDLMSEAASDKRLTHLFTKGSHHLNLNIIFITQNFFHKGAEMREITLNTQYIILCKNRRDASQIMFLARQLYASKPKYFVEVYNDATMKPFSYLLIDLKSDTPEDLRLRTDILPNQVTYVYKPRK